MKSRLVHLPAGLGAQFAPALAAFVMVTLVASLASARPRRARFEPTDLDLEKPGLVEIDTQIGVTYGDGDEGDRVVAPDFEIDIGLTQSVELNIDGMFALDRFNRRGERHWEGDPLWTGVKLGIVDWRDDDSDSGFALGAQVGPRFATVAAKGIGYGALGLFGFKNKSMHATSNFGYFIDPGPRIVGTHSQSVVTGLDFEMDLDAKSTWSFMGGIAFAYYATHEPTELTVAAGFACDLSKYWILNAMALGGVFADEDRLGILVGATPRFFLW